MTKVEKFIQSHTKEEFENYYVSHYIVDTMNYFNISNKYLLQDIRKAYGITSIAPRDMRNTTYKSFKYYTNGEKEIKIFEDSNEIPQGFYPGRVPFSEETKKHISESKKGKTTHNKGKHSYIKDGKIIFLYDDQPIPEGFIRGYSSSNKKCCHNSENQIRYFDIDSIPEGWKLGESHQISQKKSENSVLSRKENNERFEKQNNCTLFSTLKKEYPNNWWRSDRFLSELNIIKHGGYKFVLNSDIEKISTYVVNKMYSQQKIISDFEKQNNCTLLNHIIEKYGQLKIIYELPKINLNNYVFISNDYMNDIQIAFDNRFLGISSQEKSLLDFIKSIYDGEIIENDRQQIKKELDIYIPDKKLAIEFNGTYWHSSLCNIPKTYHENKSKLCEEIGIRLIHVYQDEWIYNREKIEQLLKIALNKVDNKIYARKCVVKEITNKQAKQFSNLTHLQGHRNAEITLGLFYNNELVQLMSFSKTRMARANNSEWEIIRGCPGSNNIVIGGVSKLFKYFIKTYNPKSIFSYCDFNKFNGISYEKLGMKFIGYTGPDKYWVIDGKRVGRNPSKREKLKEESNNQVIWGAGSKKYLWVSNENKENN